MIQDKDWYSVKLAPYLEMTIRIGDFENLGELAGPETAGDILFYLECCADHESVYNNELKVIKNQSDLPHAIYFEISCNPEKFIVDHVVGGGRCGYYTIEIMLVDKIIQSS